MHNKIYETEIISKLKAFFYLSLSEKKIWSALDLFGVIASYVYPLLQKDIIFSDNENKTGTLKNLIEKLKEQIKKEENDLSVYTQEGLKEYYKDHWKNKSQEVNQLLKGLKFINTINEDGTIEFKPYNNEHYENILNIGKKIIIPYSYGPKEYIQVEKYFPNLDSIFPYIWKLQLSQSQYEQLKHDLKVEKISNSAQIRKYAKLIIVYFAEWFKWEYQQSSSTKDVYSIFPENINTTNLKKILFKQLPKDLRYSTTSTSSSKENTKNKLQSSIFSLGGFPLQGDTYLNKLGQKIYELCNAKDKDRLIKEILKVFPSNDQGYRQSIEKSTGSLYQYIQYLWKKVTIPVIIHTNDKGQSIVDSWNTALKEGKKTASKYRKFKLEWEAEYYGNQLRLILLLVFKANPKTNSKSVINDNYISQEIIYNKKDKFLLTIKNGDLLLKSITFYKRDNYYFSFENYKKHLLASDVGQHCEKVQYGILFSNGKDKIDFRKDIDIYIDDVKYQSISINEYIFFRFDKYVSWKSNKTKGDLSLFIPIKEEFQAVPNTDIPLEKQEIMNSSWIPIYNQEVYNNLKNFQYKNKVIETLTPLKKYEICHIPIKPNVIHYEKENYVFYRIDKDEKQVRLFTNTSLQKLIIKKIDKDSNSTCNVKYMITCKNNKKEYKICKNSKAENIESGLYKMTIKVIDQNNKILDENIFKEDIYIVDDNFNPTCDAFYPDNKSAAYHMVRDPYYYQLSYKVYIGKPGIYNFATHAKIKTETVASVDNKKREHKYICIFQFLEDYKLRDETRQNIPLKNLCDKFQIYKKLYNAINYSHHNIINPKTIIDLEIDKKNIRLQPFSNISIIEKNNQYIIPLNKRHKDFSFCEFYYATFNNLLHENQVNKKKISSNQILLDFTPSDTDDGILFQSLSTSYKGEYFFRPMFIPHAKKPKSRHENFNGSRKKNFNQIYLNLTTDNAPFTAIIESFIFATKHHLYYTSLDTLCALVYQGKKNQHNQNVPDVDLLIKFYFAYLEYCNNNGIKDIDYEALYQLANELLFDWWFIPIEKWNRYRKKHQKDIERLLSNKKCLPEEEYAKTCIIQHFWKNLIKKNITNIDLYTEKVARSLTSKEKKKNKNDNFFNPENWNQRELYGFNFKDLNLLLIEKKNY